jgi:predicted nucleotidyltransferase
MIKFGKIHKSRNELITKARRVFGKHPKVLFAYFFGGLAHKEPLPLSDVDVAVYIADGADLAEEKLDLLGDLMGELETDEIDLVILNTAALPLKARILRNKEILLDRDPFFRHSFESLALREYFDFAVKEEGILKRRYSLGR